VRVERHVSGAGQDDPGFATALSGLPEGGRAAGSEAGEFGGHLGPGDLAPDEERLLAALERDAAALHVDPVDVFVATIRAGRDDAPPPGAGAPDDGLTPLFAAPELEEG
jgi:hypothetical protein